MRIVVIVTLASLPIPQSTPSDASILLQSIPFILILNDITATFVNPILFNIIIIIVVVVSVNVIVIIVVIIVFYVVYIITFAQVFLVSPNNFHAIGVVEVVC